MEKDRDLNDAGEALLAALAERSPDAPAPALRERLLRQALRRERPRLLPWRRSAVIAAAIAVGVLLAASLAWGLSASQTLARERTLLAQLQDAAAKDEVVFEIVDARNVTKTTLRSATDDSPTAPYGKVFTPRHAMRRRDGRAAPVRPVRAGVPPLFRRPACGDDRPERRWLRLFRLSGRRCRHRVSAGSADPRTAPGDERDRLGRPRLAGKVASARDPSPRCRSISE